MMKLFLLSLTMFLAATNGCTAQISLPAADTASSTPAPITCGSNSVSVPHHKHLNCYTNCANRLDLNRGCPYSLHYGPFCECKEGYIYKAGTSGDCVLPNDCPSV
ncbi:hypothetical protein TYRP_005327 [Tyrophagus putrescentiae]|nr:hypothetical protein TYRP_005327 [Tyrophagus putrescentiae]